MKTVRYAFFIILCCLISNSPAQVADNTSEKIVIEYANDGRAFRNDKVIVKFKKNSVERKLKRIRRKHAKRFKKFKYKKRLEVFHLNKNQSANLTVKQLQADPNVEYAIHDYVVDVEMLQNYPNDPLFKDQWGLDNHGQLVYGRLGEIGFDIDAPDSWAVNTGDGSCVIAVIDSGVDINHEDLADNIWVNPGEIPNDGIDNDGNGYIDDVNGWDMVDQDNHPVHPTEPHGTGVAGVAAAVGNNGKGIAGVAWNAKIMPIKITSNEYNPATISVFIDALEYANNNGAFVSNHSYKLSVKSSTYDFLQDLFNNSDHLIVAAAGNSKADNDNPDNAIYPASFDGDNIISVAALNNRGELDFLSNYGVNSVDLAAPGDSITVPSKNNTYKITSGTSFAAPHVAGAACLMKMQNPSLSYQAIRSAIINGVKPNSNLASIVKSGGHLNLLDYFTVEINLSAKVLLQGALVDSLIFYNYPETMIMRDDIRSKGILPIKQPYSNYINSYFPGTESIKSKAITFADYGEDSIVDWILVDLRDSADPKNIVATRAGFLQRDGDIVDLDGTSSLKFNIASEGDYYVSIRHRNHLAMMTAQTYHLNSTSTTFIDFTSTPLYAKSDAKEPAAFMINGLQALWAGDVNNNGKINFAAQDNDMHIIRHDVLNHPRNLLNEVVYSFTKYHSGDINMNGEVGFLSNTNDINLIRYNIVIDSQGNAFQGVGYTDFLENMPD